MENRGPLKGIRVIDVSHQAAGPWCTTLLGDMGADVLVENFRPGVMDRLGLGYDRLQPLNPRLTYASITAFGSTGPMANDPGMDLILQATGGMMGLTGFPGGPPAKSAGPIADIASGTYAAYAIALALLHRTQTGVGQRIDLTMLDAAISLLADISTAYLNTGHEYEKFGNGHPDLVPYQAFQANDGYFIVACLTNAFCKRLMEGLGRSEVLKNPKFTTNNDRCANRAEFLAILEEIFRTNTCAHWLKICHDFDVPACRVNSLKNLFEMEQLKAIGSVANWDHPKHGPFKTMNVLFHMSASPGSLRIPPPGLAEHTDDVLRELGKSPDEIARLRAAGACG